MSLICVGGALACVKMRLKKISMNGKSACLPEVSLQGDQESSLGEHLFSREFNFGLLMKTLFEWRNLRSVSFLPHVNLVI